MKPYAARVRNPAVLVFAGLLAVGCRSDAPSTRAPMKAPLKRGRRIPSRR